MNPWYESMGSEYKGYGLPGYERDGGQGDRGGVGTPAGLNTNVSLIHFEIKSSIKSTSYLLDETGVTILPEY